MDNFIDTQIEKAKSDKAAYSLQLTKETAMVKACEGVEGLEDMLKKALWNVDYIAERQEHFDKLLDVFYTARDLRCKCK